jgi:hypothetical protein
MSTIFKSLKQQALRFNPVAYRLTLYRGGHCPEKIARRPPLHNLFSESNHALFINSVTKHSLFS